MVYNFYEHVTKVKPVSAEFYIYTCIYAGLTVQKNLRMMETLQLLPCHLKFGQFITTAIIYNMYSEKLLYQNKKGDTGLYHGKLSSRGVICSKICLLFLCQREKQIYTKSIVYFKQEGETKSSLWNNSL